MNKKFMIGFVIATVIFCTLSVEAKNNINTDMPSTWASSYIIDLKNTPSIDISKLLNNYHSNITRGELAYLCVKLYEYYTGQEILDGENSFTDTSDGYVLKAKRAGLINGYADNTFRPSNNIRREDIAAMFTNVFIAADVAYKGPSMELFQDDDKISKWAKQAVYIAKANNIISGIGDNKFNPSGFATREQALVMLSNSISFIPRNISRFPKLGVDKIILRDVETYTKNITLGSGSTSIRVDKTDYSYESDDFVLGQWKAVDLINDPFMFDPDIKHINLLHYDSVIFYDGGKFDYKTYEYYENGTWTRRPESMTISAVWTKGLVMQNYLHEHTASRYFIATVKNNTYLFLEFKNGDYIYRNSTPAYYVFEKNS